MRHLADAEIEAVHAGGEERAEDVDHLLHCPQCRERAAELLDLAGRVSGLPALLASDEADHLPFSALERLVTGRAGSSEARSARAHLADCAECRAELADLEAFASELDSGRAVPAPPGGRQAEPRHTRPADYWVPIAAALALALGAWLLAVRAVEETTSARRGVDAATATATPPEARAGASTAPRLLLRDASGPLWQHADGRLEGLPRGAGDELVAAVLAGEALQPPALLAELAPLPEQLRASERSSATAEDAEAAAVTLLEPLAVVVESATPRFAWEGPPDLDYLVDVFDAELREVAVGAATGSTWVPSRPLRRGQTYTWQLRTSGDAESAYPRPPQPPARFHVLAAEALPAVTAARASGSHLVAAVTLAHHGLVGEAAAELRALERLNPGHPLPPRLLAELNAAVR